MSVDIPSKKLKNGFEMPVFGLGTWRMGGLREYDPKSDAVSDVEAIKRALDAGITHIDTAEVYAEGHAEMFIGEAIKGRDRSKIFLVSKVQEANLGYENVLHACRESLKRLGVEYLDLYLIHRYNKEFPLKETVRALDKLVKEGLVKNIGVSNFAKERLAEAQSYTKNKIVCNQVHYNLMVREAERTGLLTYCQNNDVFLCAWRAIERGNLFEPLPSILREMCEKYNKSPAQIAINWLISQPYVVTLSKMRNAEHLRENLGAIRWNMHTEDIEMLRRGFPNQQDVSLIPLE